VQVGFRVGPQFLCVTLLVNVPFLEQLSSLTPGFSPYVSRTASRVRIESKDRIRAPSC
jgi:hypothetical protein